MVDHTNCRLESSLGQKAYNWACFNIEVMTLNDLKGRCDPNRCVDQPLESIFL